MKTAVDLLRWKTGQACCPGRLPLLLALMAIVFPVCASAGPRMYDLRKIMVHPPQPLTIGHGRAAESVPQAPTAQQRPTPQSPEHTSASPTRSATPSPIASPKAEEARPWVHWIEPLDSCVGSCGISFYVGRLTSTATVEASGVDGFIPPWSYDWGDPNGDEAFLLAAAFSKRVLGIGRYFVVEPEIGLGQRVGALSATEIWAAIYFRWTWFPWNRWLYTTIAVATGFNYATRREAHEKRNLVNGDEGSYLLHFFSPEITFSLPADPTIEFFLRYHHRSSGKILWGELAIFNNSGAGSSFPAVGLRYRF